jgi:hypothetical protein
MENLKFDGSLDDLAESSVRMLERSGVARQTLYWRFLLVAIGAALLFAQRRCADGDFHAAAFSLGLGAAFAVAVAAAHRTELLQSQRHLLSMVFSKRPSLPCEVELTPSAMILRQGAEELRLTYHSIVAVNEDRRFVEVVLRQPKRVELIPWRAFKSREEGKKWAGELRRRANL